MIDIVEAAPEDLPTVHRLLLAYAAELPFDLGFQNFPAEVAELPGAYVRPGGLILLAKEDGIALGMGTYRPLIDDIAEIKRMYVRPAYQRRRIGHLLIDHLIKEARLAGYRRLRLDTDRASMKGAMRLYRSFGFVEIEAYGPDRDGQLAFFEKRLDVD